MEPSRFTPLGDVSSVEKTAHGLLLAVGEEKFRVDVLRGDLLRLKISQAGIFDESPTFAASFWQASGASSPAWAAFRVVDDPAQVTLDTGAVRLVISKSPFRLAAY